MAIRSYTQAEIDAYIQNNVMFRDLTPAQMRQGLAEFQREFAKKTPWQMAQVIEGNYKYVLASQAVVSEIGLAVGTRASYWTGYDNPRLNLINMRHIVTLQPGAMGDMHHEDTHRSDGIASKIHGRFSSVTKTNLDRLDRWLSWRKEQRGMSQVFVPGQGLIPSNQLMATNASLPQHLNNYGADPYKLEQLNPKDRAKIKNSMVREAVAEIGARYTALKARGMETDAVHQTLSRTYPGIYETFRELHDHTVRQVERTQNSVDKYVAAGQEQARKKNMRFDRDHATTAARAQLEQRGIDRFEKEANKLAKKFPPPKQQQQQQQQQQPPRAAAAAAQPPGMKQLTWTWAYDPKSKSHIAAADVTALIKAKMSPDQIKQVLIKNGVTNPQIYQRSNGAMQVHATLDQNLVNFTHKFNGELVKGNPQSRQLQRSPAHQQWERQIDAGYIAAQ